MIKAICKSIEVRDTVTSPTFSIVNQYLTNCGDSVYHFDFYRIKNIQEAFDMGCEEYFESGSYCFIEWPERISKIIPASAIQVNIILENSQRIINIAL